jgi:hypothetical protein
MVAPDLRVFARDRGQFLRVATPLSKNFRQTMYGPYGSRRDTPPVGSTDFNAPRGISMALRGIP